MAEPKTKKTTASVTAFIDAVENETRRADAKVVLKMLREVTGEKPAMWGPSIIGFGDYPTPSGLWPRAGFSPRKANMVLYIMPPFSQYDAQLKKLGKYKTGVSCLYLGKLADIDMGALRQIVEKSQALMNKKYPPAK